MEKESKHYRPTPIKFGRVGSFLGRIPRMILNWAIVTYFYIGNLIWKAKDMEPGQTTSGSPVKQYVDPRM